jgi:hypothetical protein
MSKLTDLRKASDLKTIREWLGLSLAGFAQEFAPSDKRKVDHVSRAMVCHWQAGRYDMLDFQKAKLAELINARLAEVVWRDDLRVSVTHHSPWHVKVMTRCNTCGRDFEIARSTARRCARCVAKRR